ncbi:MAG: hypothetical protein [Arizlama microvirus]|nr:MAG: hypothetical protein [Arizlama microvirus]
MPYVVPANSDWELFFLRMTIMIMAQTYAGAKTDIDAAVMSAVVASIDEYWLRITLE